MSYVSYENEYAIFEEITNGLKANYPADMYEPTSNIMEAIHQAASVEKILMNISATEEEIYYAFLKEELKGESYYNKSEKEETILDFNIAARMLKEDMDYITIIQCMSYSPRLSHLGNDMEKRWQNAVNDTSIAINPIYSMASEARPLSSIKLYRDEPDIIYMSCMKAVLRKTPFMSFSTMDEEIIRLLYDAGCQDKKYLRTIMQNSLNFMSMLPASNTVEDHQAVVEAGQSLDKFLNSALENIQTHESSLNRKLTDDEIYNEMNQRIRDMKEQHDKGDRFSYWATSIHIIKDTMAKLQEMQNLSKTMNIWTIGLERASIELEIDTKPQEYKELKEKIHNLINASKDTQKKQEVWACIWPIAASLEIYSREIIQQINEKQQSNPLLKLPEVQHAPDFANIYDSKAASPETLYFSCLKEIVKDNPGIQQNKADILVIDKLLQCGRDEDDIVLALSSSPSLRNLTKVQAMGAAQNMVDNKLETQYSKGGDGIKR